MQINLPSGLDNTLIWFPEKGIGYHPAPPMSYEQDYWEEYRKRDATLMGDLLTQARINVVKKFTNELDFVDIGIGGGKFVEQFGCRGYDVNPAALAWLKDTDRFCSPYAAPVESISCWDALEHIEKPWKLLRQVQKYLFVSLPIFEDCTKITESKHYKPGEHIWYFSHDGLIRWCDEQGFDFIECSKVESELGREGINTYVFRRKGSC